MHTDFAEWFRAAGLAPTSEELPKRWAGVEAFEANRNNVIALAEIFFGFFDHKESFLDGFRKQFQVADSSFRMRENDRELSVLAGATLVTIMEESETDLADLATLALVACAAQNLRATPCVAEIPELAVKNLTRRAISRSKLNENEDEDENQKGINRLRREIDVIGEESNILWWIFGETSRDTAKRWSICTVPQAAVMAGKELADLSRIAPGPAAAAALLNRVIKMVKTKPPAQVTVKDAIASLSKEWRQTFVKDHCPPPLANVTPVSNGIKLSLDLAADNAWVQNLATSTKIQHGGKIAPEILAYQIYLECLLVSLWSELK